MARRAPDGEHTAADPSRLTHTAAGPARPASPEDTEQAHPYDPEEAAVPVPTPARYHVHEEQEKPRGSH
ncbi:hypothetical protein [Streptomyces olivaceus]|uniref:hypothetical protein n=1 Tax=Streptomyces olivaceus TaxID=47716 RepID=UPI004055C023